MIEFVEKMLLDAIDAADASKVDSTFETEVIVDGGYLKAEIEEFVSSINKKDNFEKCNTLKDGNKVVQILEKAKDSLKDKVRKKI